MRKIFTIIFIFSFSVFSFAQTEIQKTPNWQTYISQKDDFSVETPQEFESDFHTINNPEGNKIQTSAKYSTVFNGTYFFIFSEVIDKQHHKAEEIPSSLLKSFIVLNSTKVKNTTIGNFTGEQFTFKDSEDFFHRILFIQTAKRAYIFHTFSITQENSDADRFFASIKFREIEDSAFAKPRAVIYNQLKASRVANSGNGQGSGSGSGSGNGGKTNSTDASLPVPTQPTEKQTSGIKILTKPRASYTDLARVYEISGSLTMRVTFLANGNIGAVTPINKLPFGLTNNAISSAKQIKFEPAYREGVPYNVVKLVQYSFTIY